MSKRRLSDSDYEIKIHAELLTPSLGSAYTCAGRSGLWTPASIDELAKTAVIVRFEDWRPGMPSAELPYANAKWDDLTLFGYDGGAL